MKKSFKKLCSIALTLIILMSSFFTMNISAKEKADYSLPMNEKSSFIKLEDEDGIRFYGVTGDTKVEKSSLPKDISIINSVTEYDEIINNKSESKKEVAKTGDSNLPDSVDNSQSKYFPEIGDQGELGSCTFWAQVYYQFTYMMNKDLGIATTPENSFSPQWTYNLIAGTDEMIGPFYNTYIHMKKQGSVLLSQVPYDFNTTSFTPTEDVWKTSIKYRIKDYHMFEDVGCDGLNITSPDDEDLTLIKTALNNGEILAYSTCINSWNTVTLKTNSSVPENNKYAGEYAVDAQIGQDGPHRMTLVGYNDNIWIDVNQNNRVDSGEMGAFKIANSWGKGYGNEGFIWVAYDALNEVSCVEGVKTNESRVPIFSSICSIEVLPYNTDADLYLKYTLNTSDRTQSKVYLTAEKDGTIYTCSAYSNESSGEKIAYDGSTKATDGTMVLLLSNAVEDITVDNFSDYTWSVSFEDTTADGNIYTVKDVEIVSETNNKVYKPQGVFPFTLDGSEKTVTFHESSLNHAVVYYRGYNAPSINYKIGDSSWKHSFEVPLTYNTERRGYTHKYVIDLGDSDNATLYFSDSNGNIDNNDGKYFTAKKGLNYYVTENVAEPVKITMTNNIDGVADINHYGVFDAEATGGYAPYQYKFTCANLDTNEEVIEEYDDKSSEGFYFRKAGNYKITAEVMDYSNTVFSTSMTVLVKDIPFSFDKLFTNDGSLFVGENITLNAITKNEAIKYRGSSYNDYTFTVKDSNNNICFTNTTKSKSCSMNYRYSEIIQSFTPQKSGDYTVTVSSTDDNKEYAEKTISFTVLDKIYGDTDGSGSINVIDATKVQFFVANLEAGNDIYKEMADCDSSGNINILDATVIQNYLASLSNIGVVGQIIKYIPPTQPATQPTTPPTQPQTEPMIKNKVTFTNSFNWGGTIYCYYWSDSNTAMTSWPGKAMTNSGKNDFSETLYTFEVPQEASYIIFNNGSTQTTDISYSGGEVRYYPIQSTDSKGHNLVETW